MILRKIEPLNWGPFFDKTVLEVEEDVTVVTAANDAGKSSFLRVLDAVYRLPKGQVATENDLNAHHRMVSKVAQWEDHQDFGCKLHLIATQGIGTYIHWNSQDAIVAGDEIIIACRLAPRTLSATVVQVLRDNSEVKIRQPLTVRKMPHVIGLPTGWRISDIINLSKTNHAERLLLEIIFGANFDADKIRSLSPAHYYMEIEKAQHRLNGAVAQAIPSSLQLSFRLIPTGDQGEITVQPYDQQFGYSPLTSRGSGIKVLLSLLVSLLESHRIDEQLMIYLDEPETSLHADAQHLLRTLLESLARRSNTQVIYATHSPAMINNMRPRSVRLMKRVAREDYVTTEIVNRPIDNNFIHIRSTLGMSASDSLQFAPVTIIVEGPSEAVGLPMLLQKLNEADISGFEDVPLIASLCHIVDGEGDSYVRQAKFAISQNSQAVVFLDGDKKIEKRTYEDLPLVAFIQISNGEEIEQLISSEIYFRSLSASISEVEVIKPTCPIESSQFGDWQSHQPEQTRRKAFTKQVDLWLDEVASGFNFVKPKVFKRAIELADASKDIRTNELKDLISEVLKLLPSKE